MQITEEQAKIIAMALMKPINDGYAESQFGVYNGDQGVVGIVRKFRKCYVFVEFNGKKDTSVKLPKMPIPLQIDIVMDRIIKALDNASTLQNKELDTEKPRFHPSKVGNFIKRRPGYNDSENKNSFEHLANEKIEIKEPVAEPAKEEAAMPAREEMKEEDSENKIPIYQTAEQGDESEPTHDEKEEIHLKEEKFVEFEKEIQPMAGVKDLYKTEKTEAPNEVELTTLENEKGEPNAFYALSEVNGSPEQSLAEIDLKKESPLCRQIAKDQKTSSEEMMKVFGILIEDAPRAAEMLYMATMVTALKVNKGDAEEIADKLGIDEKALFMANYEYELRKMRE